MQSIEQLIAPNTQSSAYTYIQYQNNHRISQNSQHLVTFKQNIAQNKIQEKSSHVNVEVSKYLDQYVSFFKQVQDQAQNSMKSCCQNRKYQEDHKIIFINQMNHEEISYQKCCISLLADQERAQIIQYQIIIGNYKISMTLLNIQQDSPNNLFLIGSGSYGKVFRINYSNNQYQSLVAKRRYFENQPIIIKTKTQNLIIRANRIQIEQVLKQYAFYKICSFYKIGPKICNNLGFDLVCFKDCIQFYLEHCLKLHFYKQDTIQQLKICTRIMHKLQLIHKDIKPTNILYSLEYKKFILSDFGISHSVKKNIGQVCITYQQGTIGYMCKQMAAIPQGQSAFVDLYYNDVHALKQVFNHLELNIEKIQCIPQVKKSKKKSHNVYKSIYLCNLLLKEKIAQFRSQVLDQKSNQELPQFFYRLISQNQKITNIINHSLPSDIFAIVGGKIKQLDHYEKMHLEIEFMIRNYDLTELLLIKLSKLECGQQILSIINKHIDLKILKLSHQSIKHTKINKPITFTKLKLKEIDNWEILQKNKKISDIMVNNLNQKIIQASFELYLLILKNKIIGHGCLFYNKLSQLRKRIQKSKNPYYQNKIKLILNLFKMKNHWKEHNFSQITQLIMACNKQDQIIFEHILFYIYMSQSKYSKMSPFIQSKLQVKSINLKKYQLCQIFMKKNYEQDPYMFKLVSFQYEIEFVILLVCCQNKLENLNILLENTNKDFGQFHKYSGQIQFRIGQIYLQNGNFLKAQSHFKRSKKIFQIIESWIGIVRSSHKLLQIQFIRNDVQKFKSGWNYSLIEILCFIQVNEQFRIIDNMNVYNLTCLQQQYINDAIQYNKRYYRQTTYNQSNSRKHSNIQAVFQFFHYLSSSILNQLTLIQINQFRKQMIRIIQQFKLKLQIQLGIMIQFYLHKIIEDQYLIDQTYLNIQQNIKKFKISKLSQIQLYKKLSQYYFKNKQIHNQIIYDKKIIYCIIHQIKDTSKCKSQLINAYYRISVNHFKQKQYLHSIYYNRLVLQLSQTPQRNYQLYKRISQCYQIMQNKKMFKLYFEKYLKSKQNMKAEKKYLEIIELLYKTNRMQEFTMFICISQFKFETNIKLKFQLKFLNKFQQNRNFWRKIFQKNISIQNQLEFFKFLKYRKYHSKMCRKIKSKMNLKSGYPKILTQNQMHHFSSSYL